MEKETLEEAAYQARRNYQDEVGKNGMNECIMLDAMKIQRGFELGAKWQAEIMYSEEEVQNLIKIIEWYDDNSDVRPNWDRIIDGLTMFEWFEQFKNK